jgi:hypothetical protein
MATQSDVRNALAHIQDPDLMASQLHMPFLGRLPIDPSIASLCDRGEVENYPGDLFDPIAQRIVKLAPVASAPKMQKQAS